jgi:hypothetical protein
MCGFLIHVYDPSTTLFSISDASTAAWSASLPAVNGDLIVDLNVRPPGFDLRRHIWVFAHLPDQGKCAHLMHKWGFMESPACDCAAEERTMRPIVDDCPLRLFADGLIGLVAMRQQTETVDRRDSGVPIWIGLESLTNVFNIKRMVIRINK